MLPTTQAVYLTTGPLALFLVGLDSIPALRSITDRIWRRSPPAEDHTLAKTVYRDEDGEATEESLRAFSDKWQRYGIALFSATGFIVTLALAVFTTFQYIDFTILNWLQVGIWILLSVQAVAFFTEPRPVQRFDLGQYAFAGSLISLAATGIEAKLATSSRNPLCREQIWIGLVIAQASSSLLRGLLCILLPRKPDVFLDGRLVDRERTVSALGRFTYSWANSLLGYAVKNKTLELTDLPKLRAEKRTDRLRENFERSRGNRPIWKALVVAHWKSLLLQLFLTFVLCVLSFGPQTALFNILRTLEEREQNSWHPLQALLWVLGLGGLLLLQSSIEAWVFWSVCSKLFVPIYAELSATVFAKSMRRKDAKHTKKSKKTDDARESAKALLADEEEDDEDDEAAMKKSRQSIINLAAVDARRISDFTSFSYLIPLSIFKVVIGCTFLVQILGWQPAFSGMAVSVLITPLNIYAAKRFTNAQDRLMKLRDSKMAVVTEVLQGIRQIKFSALEEQWQKKIGQARTAELNALWISFLFDVVLMAIWILGPLGLSAVSLTVYAVMNGGLNASVAFTAMSIFGALELSLAILPEIIADGLEAKISADRIGVYMASEEKIVNTIPADRIAFESASVAWPAEQSQLVDNDEEPRFTLQDLDLHFPNKGLSVISGRTGSGKSLLLASILGECDILQGAIKVPVPPSITARFDHAANPENWIIDSAIAYVAQIPWIENATIKSNILFGLPCDEERYQKVLVACALKKDLEMLPDGDLTDIGANGVNLSGGQRWRVSFARALYSRAGILIMDDIFSALDAHTGRYVYQNALTGELGKGRTRILVTHHVALCLPRTDYSVLLENGCVKYAGTIEELRKSNHLDDILQEEQAAGEPNRNVQTEETDDLLNPEETGLQKVISNTPHQPHQDQAQNGDAVRSKADPKKFVEDEKREVGSISLSVYKQYFAMAFNPFMFVLTAFIFLSYATLMIGRGYWMNVWASDSPTTQVHSEQLYTPFQQSMISSTSAHEDKLMMYLSVYIGISLLATILGTARYYFIFSASLRASRNFFDRLTFAVLRAPLRWLDTVPLGRILNRFTSDFHLIDSRIGYDLAFFIGAMLEVCGVMVAGFLVSPLVIVLASILLIFCLKLSLTYLAGAREIKRLESTAKSPVFEQFGSSLAGLITIRAFTKTDTFINIIYDKINDHAQAWWAMWLFNRWLSIRMNLISAIFSTITAALVVFLPGISAPLAGFALSFALQCNAAITFALRHYANIELNMNATERVMEYSSIELENQGGADAPAAWPTEGRLEVNDLVVGYAPDLPPILKGLSFTVEKNQRVGVVGRTGAGKSSLTLALFRFLEAREGQILIDGLDVSKIKLQDLRSRLAIIPQDPVLFSGTVRSNLDPFEEYEDGELYDALARVHLIASSDDDATLTSQAATPRQSSGTGSTTPDTATVQHANANVFTSLSASISEGGLNLSQGQRQLLCLARAIVARPKLMVLDEATSAVDMETDALIQQSIRAEFGRNATTLLVIAHRLSTIADFDRILVMDAGKAVEFGSPKELMRIEDGVFKNLVDNSGEKAVLEKMIFE